MWTNYTALNDGAFGMRSDLTPDGVHPSLPGYLIMDPLADAAIRAASGAKQDVKPDGPWL